MSETSNPFTDGEISYIREHRLGRLATVGPDGAPQVRPVAFRFNTGDGTFDIGGKHLATTQKYHNLLANPRAAFVLDDVAPEGSEAPSPGFGRGIEIRGSAEARTVRGPEERLAPHHDDELIRIRAARIITWNLPGGTPRPRGREVR
ncbi:PPOX class F420-dependent oxidoreductase [Actinomadura rugatobispora]|uniref:PPOX class F420-dependent oxidoreductase n=1 Tax=Actinomadura rugatobispora TaxID=1994 RepID=A0ABW1A9W5_9ACTN|nr:PPOX class F420-dependent oxidoreductase [Actinomadura rugatobispora]